MSEQPKPCPFCGERPVPYHEDFVGVYRCPEGCLESALTNHQSKAHADWDCMVDAIHRNRLTVVPEGMNGLTFDELRDHNIVRCEQSFHPLSQWNLMEWGNATAGEVGEACNVAKKIHRHQESVKYREALPDPEASESDLADELADLVVYADLWAARAGIDLGEAVRQKFNKVSEKVGSGVFIRPKDEAALDPQEGQG